MLKSFPDFPAYQASLRRKILYKSMLIQVLKSS